MCNLYVFGFLARSPLKKRFSPLMESTWLNKVKKKMSEMKSKRASHPMVTAFCRTVFRSKRFNILDLLAALIVAHLKHKKMEVKHTGS